MSKDVHWSDVGGRPFTVRLHPLMFFHTGFKKFTQLSTRQHHAKSGIPNEKYTASVMYDRDYAIKKLIFEVIEPLKYQDVETYKGLIQEAFETYQEGMKDGDAATIQKGS